MRRTLLSPWLVGSLSVLLCGVQPTRAGEVSLVEDLAPGSLGYSPGTRQAPRSFLPAGSYTVFAGFDSSTYGALWTTDGTAAGTGLLLQVDPLPLVSNGPFTFFVTGGELPGLWATDGTLEGTKRLLARDEQYASDFVPLAPTQGSLDAYFLHCARSQCQLWASAGTPESTRLLLGIQGVQSADQSVRLVRSGSRYFFSAGGSLWASDGTPQGTVPLGGIGDGPLTAVGGRALFLRDGQLWGTNGTAAGTVALTAIVGDDTNFGGSFATLSQLSCLTVFGTLIGGEMVCSDGTLNGTRQVTDFGYAYALAGEPVVAGGKVFFSATDGVAPRGLWVSDGTRHGTRRLQGCPGGCPSDPVQLQAFGARLLSIGKDAAGDQEVYASDGTASGTRVLGDHCKAGCTAPVLVGAHGPLAFFAVSLPGANGGSGSAVLRTDGTPAGTWRLPLGAIYSQAPFAALGSLGNQWLIGTVTRGGQALWSYDGTRAAPRKLRDFERPRRSCQPNLLCGLRGGVLVTCSETTNTLYHASSGVGVTPLLGDAPYGTRAVAAGGWALWSSWDGRHLLTDGTTGGTRVLPSPASTQLGPAAAVGDSFVMLGTEYTNDESVVGLYRVDPTAPQATRSVVLDSSSFGDLQSSGSFVFFRRGSTWWRSDLTPAGTKALRGAYGNDLSRLLRYRSLVLWRTDYRGLQWVRDDDDQARPLAGALPIAGMHLSGDTLFLLSANALFRIDLARLDSLGTAEPLLLRRLPRPPDSNYAEFNNPLATLADGRVVFAAYEPATGYELHVSDGTPQGTRLFVDLDPGPSSGLQSDPIAVGYGVAFVGHDREHGDELWFTEGTLETTRLAADLWPGPQSSRPDSLMVEEDRLYFSADDGVRGRELWVFE